MNRLVKFLGAIFWITCSVATIALGAPREYNLDLNRTDIAFQAFLSNTPINGSMPAQTARISIDLAKLSGSSVAVTLNAKRIKTALFFATEAVRGPRMLDTARFPTVAFKSRRIRGTVQKATIEGDLTIRGVTKRITLDAQLFRTKDEPLKPGSDLVIEMTGTIDRTAFGLDAYPNLIAPNINLRILAYITASDTEGGIKN